MLTCTIETDHYETRISKAPCPEWRAQTFAMLPWPEKQVISEPLLPYNARAFFEMITEIYPQYWAFNLFDARPWVPRPSLQEVFKLFEFCKMIIKYTDIKIVGENDGVNITSTGAREAILQCQEEAAQIG